jgi:pyrroline-5-carboxylate reductase
MMPSAAPLTVGFLGAGQMATALAKGFLAAGRLTADRLMACDVLPAAAERFREQTGGRLGQSVGDVLLASDVVFLAVKPQHMAGLLEEAAPGVRAEHLFVSIAAGIPLAALEDRLGPSARVVRVMPNTPCLVGQGASALALGSRATAGDGELVQELLSTVGVALTLPERLLDAVTGLSGSGPAYVYLMIESLSDGGVRMGLPRDAALRLAAQTVLGAAQMVLGTAQHPGVLKDAVASPGGTTIAGLQVLEQRAVRGAFIDAVAAATERAKELGRS